MTSSTSATDIAKDLENVNLSSETVNKTNEGSETNSETVVDPQNLSLYVGELDPDVTEAMLYEMFSKNGSVASVRVCRDAVTKRSLGYAYVNFNAAKDGQRAIEEMNYSMVKGRPCRIMWSQRDPSLRKTGAGNVFIKNLDPAIDNKTLNDTFSEFGDILSCKVATDEYGNSKGYGFVHFKDSHCASAAIEAVNGMLLLDKQVFVGPHVSKKDRTSKLDASKQTFTNLFVKDFTPETTEDELRSLFAKYGSITSSVIARDQKGHSKGFAFVNFDNHESAHKAVEELNGAELNGSKIYVNRAQKKSEREQELRTSYERAKMEKLNRYNGVNLFVKNLSDEIDDERLRSEFSAFGQITSAKVMLDENGKSKGFGFVCFSTPEEATKAVTELNQRMLSSKPIYVALAQRKDVRRHQLEAQIRARNQLRLQQQAAAAVGLPGFGQPIYYIQDQAAAAQQGMMGQPRPGMPYSNPQQMMTRNQRGQPMPQMGYSQFAQYPIQRPVMQGHNPAPNGRQQDVRPVVPMNARPHMGDSNGDNRPVQPAMPYESAPKSQAGKNEITAASLAEASPENQKQMLGEALYPKVCVYDSQVPGKITGMLLEMPNDEILHLLKDSSALKKKVEEAVNVLKKYQEKVEKV